MAERRMFSKTIIDSDSFLDMPLSAQALYFHLSMRADDDGFVNNPRKIQRMICCNDDDLRILMSRKFILTFESGVIVIKHWRINNYLQKDRYKPTLYTEERAQLEIKDNGAYTEITAENTDVYSLDTACIQGVNKMDTQVSIDKVSIDKDSIGNNRVIATAITSADFQPAASKPAAVTAADFDEVKAAWNAVAGECPAIAMLNSIGGDRDKQLRARVKQYGLDNVLNAIDNIRRSDFLQGKGRKGWVISFDWFIKPTNFAKVLDGNYNNRTEQPSSGRGTAVDNLNAAFELFEGMV